MATACQGPFLLSCSMLQYHEDILIEEYSQTRSLTPPWTVFTHPGFVHMGPARGGNLKYYALEDLRKYQMLKNNQIVYAILDSCSSSGRFA